MPCVSLNIKKLFGEWQVLTGIEKIWQVFPEFAGEWPLLSINSILSEKKERDKILFNLIVYLFWLCQSFFLTQIGKNQRTFFADNYSLKMFNHV